MRSSLFDLEAEIMEIIWDAGWESFAVSDVHEVLEARRAIAYTTVMTTVSRLFEKELLSRQKEGRRYVYEPMMTRAVFIEEMTREVLNSLPPVGREAAVAMLVDHVAEADDAELDRLEAMIKERRRSRGE